MTANVIVVTDSGDAYSMGDRPVGGMIDITALCSRLAKEMSDNKSFTLYGVGVATIIPVSRIAKICVEWDAESIF